MAYLDLAIRIHINLYVTTVETVVFEHKYFFFKYFNVWNEVLEKWQMISQT